MALRVLTGGANAATGTFTVTDLTGQSANSSNAAITAAITPASTGSSGTPGTPISLPKYAYLGAKQRSTTLPTGVIEMGARVYDPHIGRFLQSDPVYGGSANAYDYTNGDPQNNLDLDGRCVSFFCSRWQGLNHFINKRVPRIMSRATYGCANGLTFGAIGAFADAYLNTDKHTRYLATKKKARTKVEAIKVRAARRTVFSNLGKAPRFGTVGLAIGCIQGIFGEAAS